MPLKIPLPEASPFVDSGEYLPLLLSAVEGFLQLPNLWTTGDYPQANAFMEDLKAFLVENWPPMPVLTLPSRDAKFGYERLVVTGNPITIAYVATNIFALAAHQSAPAQNDVTEITFFVEAGYYNLIVMHHKTSNQGNVDVYQGPNLITGFSGYSAVAAPNTIQVIAVTCSNKGLNSFRFKVPNKNAASSNYFFSLQACWIEPQ